MVKRIEQTGAGQDLSGEKVDVFSRLFLAVKKWMSFVCFVRQVEAERRKREQQAEEAMYWQSFERLRRQPTEENAKAAKRAYLFLAKRYHPDQGGTHHGFLRVKDAYDRALVVWRAVA